MKDDQILDSWKEITEYLKRSRKTCLRWEKEFDLPIHRLDGTPKARVFAYKDELDRWLEETLKGKEKPQKLFPSVFSGLTSSSRSKRFIIPIIVIALFAILAIVFFRNRGLDVDPNRVVVAVFENRTGDASLDELGVNATVLITQGLTQLGLADVVAESKAIQSSSEVKVNTGGLQDMNQLRALAKATGAGTVVSGYYHSYEGRLQFLARATDVLQRDLVYAFQAISGSWEFREELIEALYQRILGALAFHFDPTYPPLVQVYSPPTYEAYQEFKAEWEMAGVDWAQVRMHWERAVELDPRFTRARLWIAETYYNEQRFDVAESYLNTVNEDREKLNPYYRSVLDYLVARAQHRAADGLRHLREAQKLAPRGYIINFLVAVNARRLNRPQETVDVFTDNLNIYRIPPTTTRIVTLSRWFQRLSQAYHMLGKYKEELEVARRGREIFPNLLAIRLYDIRALVGLGKINQAKKEIDECMTMEESERVDPGIILVSAAEELRAHGYEEVAH